MVRCRMRTNTIRSEIKFATIVEQLRFANLELQAGDSACVARSSMPAYGYAKCFQVVTVDIGRTSGKTSCLLELTQPNDVVFGYGYYQTQQLDRVLSCLVFNGFYEQVRGLRPAPQVDTVWIDNASLLKPEALDQIIHLYAGHAEQFVLLG